MTEQELMLTHLLNCRRIDLIVDRPELNDAQIRQLQIMEYRRRNGESLQYILGECEFMGLTLMVDRRVLIPRPETELLVETAILKSKDFKKERLSILEIGTGSGNIAIALAKNIPGCQVTSVDISSEALIVAEANARRNCINDRIQFIKSNLFEFVEMDPALDREFDIIISNPPYIPANQLNGLPADVQNEPRIALDGGADGLDFYRRIILESVHYLKKGGLLLFEIGEDQRSAIEEILREASRFTNVQCQKDYSHKDRIISAEKD